MVSVTQRKAGSMGEGKLLKSGKFRPQSSKVKINCLWISITLIVKAASLVSAFNNQDDFPRVHSASSSFI